MKYLAFYSLILSLPAFSMGSPYNSTLDAMSDTTAEINRFVKTTDQEGQQDKQWEQEEERMELTDKEKEEENREKEQKKIEENIDSYRFDVPVKKGLD